MNSAIGSKRTLWFKRWGLIYRPVHAMGFGIALSALTFLANVFVALDAPAHSVADLLDRFYVFAAPTFLGLMWITARTSDENGGEA